KQAVVIDQPALAGLQPRYDVSLFAPSPATTGDGQRLRPDDFISPETCAECHASQHTAWQASAHGQAGDNPAYQGWLLAAIQSTESRMTRFCAACHTPGGMLVGQVRVERNWRGFFLRPFGDAAREGVSCAFCHSVTSTTGLGNGAYVSDPQAPIPAGQDASPHKRTYSRDWYGSAEFCATCHQAQHPDNGLPLMTTYSEWRDSPYNTGDPATTRACQGCHGAGHDGVSQEQLASAAQVQVIEPATIRPGQVNLRVEVRNVGAGHALPTGATELRKMWLEVTVADANGQELFRSGDVDSYGDPDENTVTYGTVWEDGSGAPTIRMWEAAALVSDHRIPPQALVTETYSFNVPQDVQGPLQAQAVLKYRAISGYFAAIMGVMADSQGIESPVVEMAQDEVLINVEK
ncbi:MAG: hypothetical protein GY824_26130, partial [Delftia sp.]|nr:hypothetical protein [Delftia sp.]